MRTINHTQATAPANPFRDQLAENIADFVSSEKRHGTTGMSMNNLIQCVCPPQEWRGAPAGTNSQYCYAEMFHEILAADKTLSRFVI